MYHMLYDKYFSLAYRESQNNENFPLIKRTIGT